MCFFLFIVHEFNEYVFDCVFQICFNYKYDMKSMNYDNWNWIFIQHLYWMFRIDKCEINDLILFLLKLFPFRPSVHLCSSKSFIYFLSKINNQNDWQLQFFSLKELFLLIDRDMTWSWKLTIINELIIEWCHYWWFVELYPKRL